MAERLDSLIFKDIPLISFDFNDALLPETVEKLKTSGLYVITNTINHRFNIGVASKLINRFRAGHRNHLMIGTHENRLLQEDWNNQNGQGFTFKVMKIANTKIELELLFDEEPLLIYEARKQNLPIYNFNICRFRYRRISQTKEDEKTLTQKRFSKNWIIIYPNKQVIKSKNLRQSCRDLGLANHKAMIEVADGKREHYKGFKCFRGDGNIKRNYPPRLHLRGTGTKSSKRYEITFPDQHKEIILGLKNFCHLHNLPYSKIHQLIYSSNSGHINYRGYRCRKL